jgi:hypothetical protein
VPARIPSERPPDEGEWLDGWLLTGGRLQLATSLCLSQRTHTPQSPPINPPLPTTYPHFQARSLELRKALSDVAELIFVDAPHLLPLWYRPREEGGAADANHHRLQQQQQQKEEEGGGEINHQQQQEEEQEDEGDSALPPVAAAPPKLPPRVHKRAWLLSPELLKLSRRLRAAADAGGLLHANCMLLDALALRG